MKKFSSESLSSDFGERLLSAAETTVDYKAALFDCAQGAAKKES